MEALLVRGGATHPAARRFAVEERLRERFRPLGALSPFATLDTFSPGARRLLARMERDAERLLHIVRLILALAMTAVYFFGFGLASVVPAALIGGGVTGAVLVWTLVWRHLGQHTASFRLRVALALIDTMIVARAFVMAQIPLPGSGSAGTGLLSPVDIQAMTPSMLVFLALSGAFRLDPRLAALTTILSFLLYTYLVTAFPTAPAPAIANAVVIWVAGALGANAARVLRTVALRASEEQVLERYVPEGLTQELARAGEVERGGREEDVSVLMADIRGFTGLSEQLTPAGAVALLNEYFTAVVAPLARESAVLDKYIGDGVLAFFEGPNHADRAVRAGRGMLDAVEAFNAGRSGERPIRIGVAIHAGGTLVGTIGAPSRREYTVVGDVVNVAARLEEWNKGLHSKLIVSEEVLARVTDTELTEGLEGPVSLDLHGRGARALARYLPADPV
ncbi:MAG: hypothetical protein HY534_04710 [Chloroflexi bacterium]|nr:hypothetical protein [Chloroflexota bacterium]